MYTQMLHVWNIQLHLARKWLSFVGRYPIDGASGIGEPMDFNGEFNWHENSSMK